MRKLIAVFAVAAAVLAVPAGASAQQYVLKHPKREHCRAHYVRKVEHGNTSCTLRAPTTMVVSAESETSGGFAGEPLVTYIAVRAALWSRGTQLVGLPIRYTITDATTGQFVGSFVGLSNAFATCTLVTSFNAQFTVKYFAGEPVVPHSACALAAPVSIPAADLPRFAASFAGNSTYAPSDVQELA
jgi:hypothetical protein